MYEKECAEKIYRLINKSKQPVLVEKSTHYIKGYERFKYYYPNEIIKNKHKEDLNKLKWWIEDKEYPLYETLYANLYEENSNLKVLVGIFYKRIGSII